jgi:hypothetical protein
MSIVLMMPSPGKENGAREAASALVSSPQEHMDDGLPLIFKEQPFLKRMYKELSLHHRWSCVFFKSFDDDSSSFRLFSVFTSACFVFFLNSLMYNVGIESEPQTDAVQICFLAACISVVGAPVFVLIDASVRHVSNAKSLELQSLGDSKALRSEYTTVIGNIGE